MVVTKQGDILLGVEDIGVSREVMRIKKCIRLYIGEEEIKVVGVLPMLNNISDVYVNKDNIDYYSYDIKEEYINKYIEVIKK